MIELVDGKFNDKITSFIIIDCRYTYEYEGGHIPGAKNLPCPLQVEKYFFEQQPKELGSKVVVVFHCEYSVQRAPRM